MASHTSVTKMENQTQNTMKHEMESRVGVVRGLFRDGRI